MGQIHVAKLPAVFDAHAFEPHPDRLLAPTVIKQLRLLGLTNEGKRQRPGAQPPRFISQTRESR